MIEDRERSPSSIASLFAWRSFSGSTHVQRRPVNEWARYRSIDAARERVPVREEEFPVQKCHFEPAVEHDVQEVLDDEVLDGLPVFPLLEDCRPDARIVDALQVIREDVVRDAQARRYSPEDSLNKGRVSGRSMASAPLVDLCAVLDVMPGSGLGFDRWFVREVLLAVFTFDNCPSAFQEPPSSPLSMKPIVDAAIRAATNSAVSYSVSIFRRNIAAARCGKPRIWSAYSVKKRWMTRSAGILTKPFCPSSIKGLVSRIGAGEMVRNDTTEGVGLDAHPDSALAGLFVQGQVQESRVDCLQEIPNWDAFGSTVSTRIASPSRNRPSTTRETRSRRLSRRWVSEIPFREKAAHPVSTARRAGSSGLPEERRIED